MKRISDSTAIIATRELGHREYEVCATLVADFDEDSEHLTLRLDAFVREVIQAGPDVVLHPDWLPHGETVRHHVPLTEAREDAHAAFHAWTKKVAAAIPTDFAV